MKTMVTTRPIWDPELNLRLAQVTFVTADESFFARYPKRCFETPTKAPRRDHIGRVVDESVTIVDWKARQRTRKGQMAEAAKELLTSADLKEEKTAEAVAEEQEPEASSAAADASDSPGEGETTPEGSEATGEAPAASEAGSEAPETAPETPAAPAEAPKAKAKAPAKAPRKGKKG